MDNKNPIVTIEMENGGIITAELYPEIAPNTVNNFISLINKGFYDGIIFHRVIPGFMIQGGDPAGTGMGGPGYSIKGEFAVKDGKLEVSFSEEEQKRSRLRWDGKLEHSTEIKTQAVGPGQIPNLKELKAPYIGYAEK